MILRVFITGWFSIGLLAGFANGGNPTTRPSSNWTPPASDPSVERVGGASRSWQADPGLLVSLLAPADVVGLTANGQPTLYWYLTKPTNRPIEITLTPLGDAGKDTGAAPILDVVVPKTEACGIQALPLAKPPGQQPPVSLDPNVQYDWVVEVVEHDRSGSDNPTAATRVERISAPEVVSKAKPATLKAQYDIYRQSGLWYDMLDTLNQMIDADKDNAGLRQTRRQLLKDQNLSEDDAGAIIEKAKNE